MQIGFIGNGAWSRKNQEVAKSLGLTPVVRTYDYEDILENENIKAIYICTPAPTLIDIANKCREANKFILTEKGTFLKAEDAVQFFGYNKLMVNYTYCYHPVIKAIKELYSGKLEFYTSTKTSVESSHRDGSSFINHGIHDIAKLIFLTDNIPIATSRDSTTIEGANFSITNYYRAPVRRRNLQIDDGKNEYIFNNMDILINNSIVSYSPKNPLNTVWEVFLKLVCSGVQPVTDHYFAYRVASAIEQIESLKIYDN